MTMTYADFSYKRYRPKRRIKRFLFPLILVVLVCVVGAFIFNIFSNGATFRSTFAAEVDEFRFWATIESTHASKTDAMKASRASSGAGFIHRVDADGKTTWQVIYSVTTTEDTTAQAFTRPAATHNLLASEHIEMFQTLANSFRETITALNGLIHERESPDHRELTLRANQLRLQLQTGYLELEQLQHHANYRPLFYQITHQFMHLVILAGTAPSANQPQTVKHAIAGIAFASLLEPA